MSAKPERHQRVEHALDQPVEGVEKQKLHRRPDPLAADASVLSHTAPPLDKGGAASAGATVSSLERSRRIVELAAGILHDSAILSPATMSATLNMFGYLPSGRISPGNSLDISW